MPDLHGIHIFQGNFCIRLYIPYYARFSFRIIDSVAELGYWQNLCCED